MKFYMQWRESFDDQNGWFTESELKTEILRIEELIKEDDGEAMIYFVIEGKDVTDNFYKEQT